jgi:hypothetical protein
MKGIIPKKYFLKRREHRSGSYEDKKNLFTNRYSTSVNSVPMDWIKVRKKKITIKNHKLTHPKVVDEV